MDTFEKFLNDFKDGKLEPHLKSEAVPDNSENAVKVSSHPPQISTELKII